MSHPPELESLPTAGSLVGRHLIVREIAKGTVGPLYLARTQNNDQGTVTAVDTLARVIPLPADLPPRDDQYIAEAIWDSANVGHDLVLRVADVIAGKGWVTLVHDHYVGSLVASMHRRARELGSSFPSEVAARIALDVLEGLEQSRGLCEANRIPWRPGSISLGSLYLCGDGRTRALDGQVVAAVMRSAHMRMLCGTSASVAPEMMDAAYEPDERTDVFAVGTVLWEMLTGREILVDSNAPIANVILSVPKGTEVPQGLVYALHRALELEPNKRQSTLRELAVELVMGAEKVATYEQVIEFASTLLPFEAAFQPEPSVPPPVYAQAAVADAAVADAAVAQAAYTEVAAPVPTVEPQPAVMAHADESPPVVQNEIQWAQQQPVEEAASLAAEPDAEPPPPAAVADSATPSQPAAVTADDVPTVAAPAVAPTAPVDVPAAAAAPGPVTRDGTAPSLALDVGSSPKGARLEQISWPDEEIPRLGAAARLSAGSAEPLKKSNGAKPSAAGSKSGASSPSAAATKSRPSSRAVEATAPSGADLVAEVLRKAGKGPAPAVERKKGGLHISMTTLILGFSTTVLAVVLIMILMQRNSTSNAPAAPSPVTHAAKPAEQSRAEPAAAQPERGAEQPATEQDRTAAQRSSTVSGKGPEAAATAPAAPTETKVERPRRSSKSSVSAAAKSADDGASDDSKGQKKPKTYVPNDL